MLRRDTMTSFCGTFIQNWIYIQSAETSVAVTDLVDYLWEVKQWRAKGYAVTEFHAPEGRGFRSAYVTFKTNIVKGELRPDETKD